VALDGGPGGPTATPATVLASALHLTFAAQAAIALLGAAVALLVIGRAPTRPRHRPEPHHRDEEHDRPLAQATA
jgi:hypothetical protein